MAVVIVQDQDTIVHEAILVAVCGDVHTGVDHAIAVEVVVVVLDVALS